MKAALARTESPITLHWMCGGHWKGAAWTVRYLELEERPSANRDLLLAAPVTVYQLSDKIETERSTCMTGASFLPFVNKKGATLHLLGRNNLHGL